MYLLYKTFTKKKGFYFLKKLYKIIYVREYLKCYIGNLYLRKYSGNKWLYIRCNIHEVIYVRKPYLNPT